jgi:hypothetical protein
VYTAMRQARILRARGDERGAAGYEAKATANQARFAAAAR